MADAEDVGAEVVAEADEVVEMELVPELEAELEDWLALDELGGAELVLLPDEDEGGAEDDDDDEGEAELDDVGAEDEGGA